MNKENILVPGLPSGFEDRWNKKLILKKKLINIIEDNFIKLASIILINFFLRINFLFHLSSNPEGNAGINLFSLFIFLVPGLRIELKLKVPQTFVLTVTPPRHSLCLYYFYADLKLYYR